MQSMGQAVHQLLYEMLGEIACIGSYLNYPTILFFRCDRYLFFMNAIYHVYQQLVITEQALLGYWLKSCPIPSTIGIMSSNDGHSLICRFSTILFSTCNLNMQPHFHPVSSPPPHSTPESTGRTDVRSARLMKPQEIDVNSLHTERAASRQDVIQWMIVIICLQIEQAYSEKLIVQLLFFFLAKNSLMAYSMFDVSKLIDCIHVISYIISLSNRSCAKHYAPRS